jgi:hypothetical protein
MQTAMRRAGMPRQELSSLCSQATEADDDITQRTCLRRVQVDVR